MTWSYDTSDLVDTTASGRLNVVRLLIGDTDTTDQQLQDEEIEFALDQSGDNVYFAASWAANAIASKYSRRVTTKLDGALSAEYSDLAKQYRNLSYQLSQDGKKYSGDALGVGWGGLRSTEIDAVRDDTTRVTPAFRMDRFRYPKEDDYLSDYIDE